MEPGAVELSGLSKELVVKEPGTVNGADVVLKDLRECEVYVLDYSGEVEVSNCVHCKIFIGPVDGPAIFRQVQGCKVAVASQQCQVVDSSDLDLGLYCATRPTVERCFNIRVSCWMGAYAGLSKHFQQCNLDPSTNLWDQVHSAGADDQFGGGFELVEAVEYWEPPLEGQGPPENPVPAPDGTLFQSPAHANGNPAPADNGFMDFMEQPGDSFGGQQPDAFGATDNGGSGSGLGGTGGAPGGSGAGLGGSLGGAGGQTGAPQGDHPKVAAMKEQMQQRLQRQEEEERQAKTQLSEQAATHLESFYQKRQDRMAQRAKENRSGESSTPGGLQMAPGSSGTPWEKTLGFIDFGFQRGTSADKARFKNVLFAAKTNKTAV